MYLVKIYVTYKPSVFDPQGEVVKRTMERLEFMGIDSVRIGKYIELTMHGEYEEVVVQTQEACEQLLANATTQTYRYDILTLEETMK